ncbi:ATP-binding protein [Streptomyces sp. NPDC059568]|uniref:ATP-binding protein n=1 Tax=Streptomyces sp. NPDC059568 TaxID=3346868 RepID=UPI0036C77BF6
MTATRPTAIGAPGYSETLPCEDASARRARRLVRTALNTWGLGNLVDTGELIVSELVANAVQHSGCPAMRVSISRSSDDRVRITVRDNSRAAPVVRKPSSDAEAGRGMLLIEAHACRWGTDVRRWGKHVWAELLVENPDHHVTSQSNARRAARPVGRSRSPAEPWSSVRPPPPPCPGGSP